MPFVLHKEPVPVSATFDVAGNFHIVTFDYYVNVVGAAPLGWTGRHAANTRDFTNQADDTPISIRIDSTQGVPNPGADVISYNTALGTLVDNLGHAVASFTDFPVVAV